ncbi:hypothetical protein [Nonomuraea jabiensis]|uniref:hypothetical protein n=1 Tax=Nonomuraea jabiensis TaxID=882448 RepID=UPI003D756128
MRGPWTARSSATRCSRAGEHAGPAEAERTISTAGRCAATSAPRIRLSIRFAEDPRECAATS